MKKAKKSMKKMQSTGDVKTNIKMAVDFLNEQRQLLKKQELDVQKQREEKNLRAKKLSENSTEIELKGKEREKLIEEVESLMKVKLDRDVKLIETGHDSNRYVRCIYKSNRMTLEEYLTSFSETYAKGLEEDMKENPVPSLLQYLHERKLLKKNFKPYSTAVAKGYFEEKPVRIYVCPKKRAMRVETDVFLTASGSFRLHDKELKRIVKAAV